MINTMKVTQTKEGHRVVRIDHYPNNPDHTRLLVQIDDGFQIESHAYFDNGEYWIGEPTSMDLIEDA